MYSLQSNQNKFITNLNPLFLSLLVLMLIIFKSTSEAILPSLFIGWDVLIPVAIYLGQRRNLWEGLLLILFLAHLYSLNSSAPIGMFVVYYLLFFFLAQTVSYILYAQTPFSVLCLIFTFVFSARICLPLVGQAFGQTIEIFSLGNWNLWHLLLNTLMGFFVYWILGFLDRATLKVPPRNITLGDSAL